MERVHVFFVDDHPAVQAAVRQLLGLSGVKVTAFGSAEECLSMIQRQTCDIVVTDIRLTGMDGIALVQQLSQRFPWIPTIAVTAYSDTSTVVRAMKAGASDFIDKPFDPQQLLSAIEKAIEAKKRPASGVRENLSESETRVLRLILNGMTCKEIADELHRSARTIESHRHRIMRKLDARNVAQLIQRAYELGYNPIQPNHPISVGVSNEA